jgi:hypothetical protein
LLVTLGTSPLARFCKPCLAWIGQQFFAFSLQSKGYKPTPAQGAGGDAGYSYLPADDLNWK